MYQDNYGIVTKVYPRLFIDCCAIMIAD